MPRQLEMAEQESERIRFVIEKDGSESSRLSLCFKISSLYSRLRLDVLIEARSCGFMIRLHIKGKKAEGQGGKQNPADEAEIEAEELPLFPVHELAAFCDRFICRKIRIVEDNIIGHRIGIAFDDSGDEKEQRPKENIDPLKDSGDAGGAEILESAEQNIKIGALGADQGGKGCRDAIDDNAC